MEDLYLLDYQNILENLCQKKHVVIVVCILIEDRFVESLRQMELKILMFVIIGGKDISKDEASNDNYLISNFLW